LAEAELITRPPKHSPPCPPPSATSPCSGASPAPSFITTPDLSTDQIITPLADSQWVRATVADTDQLRWWLLGFGNQVEVLEPVELREEFRWIARGLLDMYEPEHLMSA
jgi:hypothetical protein